MLYAMRLKHIEPHRTFSNYILTEIARYIDFFHTSSGWFECTEPSPTTGDTRCAGCNLHRFEEVQAHRTSLNLLERDNITRYIEFFLHEFGVVRLDRTFSDYIFSTLSTSLQGKQGVQGAYALFRGGSSTLNLY